MALGPARRIASASTLALARAIPSFTHRQRIERLLGNTCAAKAACRMQKTRARYASRPLPDSPSVQDVVTMTQRSARTDKVVIVHDHAPIPNLLSRYRTQEGLEVIVAEDGHALNRILLRDTVDLIVLDLVMPGEDGLSVCRRLRAANDRTPIIMLTAKGEDMHRIAGLEVGADDYLAKPFNPHELRARMRAGLRRRPPRAVPGAPSIDNDTVNFGPFSFNLGSRTLKKDGEALSLTDGEFAMLKALVRHPRQPLSRGKLGPFTPRRACGVGRRKRGRTPRGWGALATCLCRTGSSGPMAPPAPPPPRATSTEDAPELAQGCTSYLVHDPENMNRRHLFLLAGAWALGACGKRRPRVAALKADARVLALGDSLTVGYGAAPEQAWPAQLAQLTGWQVDNEGVNGDTSAGALQRLEALLSANSYDAVLVGIGGNDMLRSVALSSTKASVAAIARMALAHTPYVALIATPAPEPLRAAAGALGDAGFYAELAEAEKVLLIPGVYAAVLSDPALRSDRIHANAQGYAAVAQQLADQLEAAGWR